MTRPLASLASVVLGPMLAAAALLAVFTPPASAQGSPRLFAASSFWNKPLSRGADLDPRSGAYVGDLLRQLRRTNPWINTDAYSTPVYTVPRNQPTVRVSLGNPANPLQAAWEAVPIPRNARAAQGSDRNMVVWQPSTDTMWEFWLARKGKRGWRATYGGRMSHVSKNPGYYDNLWGASATSLPLVGGLMRLKELKAGRIDHALAIAIPRTSSKVFSWPARRSDGNDGSRDAIPAGARFRIDPRLDLDKLPMSPMVRMMARAAQRYGMVVRDRAGSVAFYGEDPTPTGKDPYHGRNGLFRGYMNQVLRREFPWRHLQALKTDTQRF